MVDVLVYIVTRLAADAPAMVPLIFDITPLESAVIDSIWAGATLKAGSHS